MGLLQTVMWGGIVLGGLVDLYSLLLLLRCPGADGRRPSPVFGVPVVLYLMCAGLAVSAQISFPVGLVVGLVLLHLGLVLGVPALLARWDRR